MKRRHPRKQAKVLDRRRDCGTGEGTVNPESPSSCRCGARWTTISRPVFRTLARRSRRTRLLAREMWTKRMLRGPGRRATETQSNLSSRAGGRGGGGRSHGRPEAGREGF